MQLTRIVLNAANRHARADLSDPYEMHSTLSRAFAAGDGQPVRRFLWRQESSRPGEPNVVLVQSADPGEWQGLFAARLKLAELPRNSSPTRIRNRCDLTGRPRGYYRKLRMSRIALRDLGSQGLIPGMIKSSW